MKKQKKLIFDEESTAFFVFLSFLFFCSICFIKILFIFNEKHVKKKKKNRRMELKTIRSHENKKKHLII